METGEEIIVGRMGQQPMHITEPSVAPQHAILRKTAEDVYQIEDYESTKGIFVFGMRIKRKTIKAETPIVLGTFKTSVRHLLQDYESVSLESVWIEYDTEKRQWDRKSMIVNYLRVLPSILTMLLGMFVGPELDNTTRMGITVGLTIAVLIISMIASEKILAKKNLRMAELNQKLQDTYICPHCHRFLGFTPYRVLKEHKYCQKPDCGCPLP